MTQISGQGIGHRSRISEQGTINVPPRAEAKAKGKCEKEAE